MLDVGKMGSLRLAKRRKEAQRLLKENGAIHNVFAGTETPRPWNFDPIPLVFGLDEWAHLEKGLIQRAGTVEPDSQGSLRPAPADH